MFLKFKNKISKIAHWGLGAVALLVLDGCAFWASGPEAYCGDEQSIDKNALHSEYIIPMSGDSSLVYWGNDFYHHEAYACGVTNKYYHSVVNFCLRKGGQDLFCEKNLKLNHSDYLISTYEDGVFILNPINVSYDPNPFVQWEVYLWDWKKGTKTIDTLENKMNNLDLFSLAKDDKMLKYSESGRVLYKYGDSLKEGLLTVAKTDSGFFLRLKTGLTSLRYDPDVYNYLNVNMSQKYIDTAKMDTATVYDKRSNSTYLDVKCKLGQWSYEGNKICGIQDDSYSFATSKAAVSLNDSIVIDCPGGWGGGFFRFFYIDKRTIKPINIRNLTSDLNDMGREFFKKDGECK